MYAWRETIKRWAQSLPARLVLWATVIFLAYALGQGYFSREKPRETVQIKTQGIGSVVSVQGTVVPSKEVELGFEVPGKVTSVSAKVGKQVRQGDTLASLSQDDLAAQLANLRALRDAAQAKLNDLRAGTRPEDIAVAESQVLSAQNERNQARELLAQYLEDAYDTLDDAVRSKTDQLFNNPRTPNVSLAITADTALTASLETTRVQLEAQLSALQYRTYSNPTEADVVAMRALVDTVRVYLDQLSTAVNRLKAVSSLSETTIDAYKTAVSAARSSVSTFNTALVNTYSAYTTTEAALTTAQSQLALKKAGATPADIEAQAAQVRAAEANIRSAQATVGKRVIAAPFAGTVTDVGLKVGSVVSGPSSGTITIITAQSLQLESYVPEVYIAQIALGDAALVTLDAYSATDVFPGTVVAIDPSATLRDGVSTYKITLQFEKPDERIKAGMNGDIRITASKTPLVVTVPKKSLLSRNGTYFVQMPTEGNRVLERAVTVSSFNEADVAEISEGLSDGDVIFLEPIE